MAAIASNGKMSQTWHYRFEHHKMWYGSLLFVAGAFIVGVAGHDMVILRNIASGTFDINAAKDLYLNISNPAIVGVIGGLGDAALIASIAYMVLVGIAQRQIARNSI